MLSNRFIAGQPDGFGEGGLQAGKILALRRPQQRVLNLLQTGSRSLAATRYQRDRLVQYSGKVPHLDRRARSGVLHRRIVIGENMADRFLNFRGLSRQQSGMQRLSQLADLRAGVRCGFAGQDIGADVFKERRAKSAQSFFTRWVSLLSFALPHGGLRHPDKVCGKGALCYS